MKVGIVGAGAIGTALGGRIARGGARVVLVGRPWLSERVQKGLQLSRWGEPPVPFPAERVQIETELRAVADCDAVFVATKSRDTRAVARALASVLPEKTPVGSLQNGIRNAEVLAEELPGRTIWPGMVSFNVVWADDDQRLHQGTSGPVVLPVGAEAVVEALRAGGTHAEVVRDIRAVQWGKLLLNLNNAVNALSDLPIRQMLSDRGYRRIIAALIREALAVLKGASIPVRGVGRLQPRLAPFVLDLPDWLFFRAAAAMIRIDPFARTSMADDLARGRPTEVDELNGEIVSVAEKAGSAAPLNAAMVRLVHSAERERAERDRASGKGPRIWTATALWAELTASDSGRTTD